MNATFVNQLRTNGDVLTLSAGEDTWQIRAEVPEVWDVVRIDAAPTDPVLAIKVNALESLLPNAKSHDEYVVKLGGFEVLDESLSLEQAGAKNGSIFLITNRRRQPVRG